MWIIILLLVVLVIWKIGPILLIVGVLWLAGESSSNARQEKPPQIETQCQRDITHKSNGKCILAELDTLISVCLSEAQSGMNKRPNTTKRLQKKCLISAKSSETTSKKK